MEIIKKMLLLKWYYWFIISSIICLLFVILVNNYGQSVFFDTLLLIFGGISTLMTFITLFRDKKTTVDTNWGEQLEMYRTIKGRCPKCNTKIGYMVSKCPNCTANL